MFITIMLQLSLFFLNIYTAGLFVHFTMGSIQFLSYNNTEYNIFQFLSVVPDRPQLVISILIHIVVSILRNEWI